MQKKSIYILILITILTFANSLFNGFIGDDQALFFNNSFYQSLDNFPALFTKEYLTDGTNVVDNNLGNSHSGSVAYRPVLSATFFLDHAFWKKNPFGYHLTNLGLHLLNVLLVFWITFHYFRDNKTAFLSALLFSVHPTKTEAICSIGYRADILYCLFVLTALILYVKRDSVAKRSNTKLLFSHIFYFLALFTKEASIVLPFLIVGQDLWFQGERTQCVVKNLGKRYLGYILITCFYLYIYFFVFRNTTLGSEDLMGGTVLSHLLSMGWIFTLYVRDLIFPFLVRVIPPLYVPSLGALVTQKAFLICCIFITTIFGLIRTYQHSKKIFYFLFWFLFSLLPVSNIIPNPNPMAHRFLYFPSIGLMIVCAVFIVRVLQKIPLSSKVPDLKKIIVMILVGMCIATTVPLNAVWKDDYTVARNLIKYFPEHFKGYSILGFFYFKVHKYIEAKEAFEQSLKRGSRNPRVYYMLGIISVKDPQKAKTYFRKSIALFPLAVIPYNGLGKIYLFQEDTEGAILYFQEGLAIAPNYIGYAYLIQAHLIDGQIVQARDVLKHAEKTLIKESHIRLLRKLIDEADNFSYPIDIGI